MLVEDKALPNIKKEFTEGLYNLSIPDPQVLERPMRRKFTAEYKLRILKEIDSLNVPGGIGAILRREGIYYSNIQKWRIFRIKGELESLDCKKRGPKNKDCEKLTKRINELEKEKRLLQKRLKKAELINDIQKKISLIAGIPLNNEEFEEENS